MTTEEEERQEEERHTKLAIIPSKMYHKQRKTTRKKIREEKKQKESKTDAKKNTVFCISIAPVIFCVVSTTVFALITCRRKNTQKILTDVFVGVCVYMYVYIYPLVGVK